MKNKTITIQVLDTNNIRIDQYLVNHFKDLSRSQIQKEINLKRIQVNNELINKSGYKVFQNDVITITSFLEQNTDQQENKITKETTTVDFNNINIPVLYEDEYFLVLDKPNDLLVYETIHDESLTLSNYLKFKYPNLVFEDQQRYGIVHRLDRKTSGLILVAKTQSAFVKLSHLFQERLINKKYICIVHNCFSDLSKKIKIANEIGRSFQNTYKMQVGSGKDLKEAITIIKIIKNISNTHALVECDLVTGRTHQIRVHMKYINHPIVNDELYGIEKQCSEYGQYLYCSHIDFIHPFANKPISIDLDLPIEFKEKIEELENA